MFLFNLARIEKISQDNLLEFPHFFKDRRTRVSPMAAFEFDLIVLGVFL